MEAGRMGFLDRFSRGELRLNRIESFSNLLCSTEGKTHANYAQYDIA
jgi:hypothetical protein